MKIIFFYSFSFLFFISISRAQKVTYTTEGIHGINKVGYNIVGKINEKYFINIDYFEPAKYSLNPYGINRHGGPTINKSYIYIYDKQMQLLSKEELQLPDECFGLSFITYENFIYIFYQYVQNTHVFCMAAKIDSTGKMSGKPVMLSDIILNYSYTNSSFYAITHSEDKKKIAIFTIKETPNAHELNLLIFDKSLKIIEHKIFQIPIGSEFESFSDFRIDNEGNFFFLKTEPFNDLDPYKNVLNLIEKKTDTLSFYNMTPMGIKLNDLSFRINNADKKLNLFSFYVDLPLKTLWNDIPLSKATSKSGIYNAIWDIKNKSLTETAVPFTEMLGSNSDNPELNKLPIQDFFVGDIYYTKKGSFVLQWQNSDPYNPYKLNSIRDGEFYDPGITASWYIRYYNTNPNRHFANYYSPDRIHSPYITKYRTQSNINPNLLLLSFDPTGTFTKFNFAKEFKARDFMTMNTGNALHYFFIRKERNNYVVDHLSFTNNGGIQTEIPLKIDKNYKFALGYKQTSETLAQTSETLAQASKTLEYKQVSETELIFPVFYLGVLNFAKIEF